MSIDQPSLDWLNTAIESGQSHLFNDTEGFRSSMLRDYVLDGAFDEMFTADGNTRPHYKRLLDMFARMPQERSNDARRPRTFRSSLRASPSPCTGDEEGTERIFPNDLLPRIITNSEWEDIERGLISASRRSTFSCRMFTTKAEF